MNDLLTQLTSHTLAGNPVLKWLLAAVVSIVVSIVLRLAFRLLHRQLLKLSSMTSMDADDFLVASLSSTKSITFIMAGVWAGARLLTVEGATGRALDFALLVVVVLQLAIWTNSMVSAYIRPCTDARREVDPAAVSVMQGVSILARLAIWSPPWRSCWTSPS